ncbi:MAG: hypothetical protein A4E57_02112 [Syntrophorhabdaceae bacterium PtaU1.Bin034]|nr:MAG: hypothetical protein A4E57_02112 [Syntrophorhabdaceae bacterium PtaU1.Bin034]
MAELLTNLVENNDSIKGAFRTRSKSFYEKTVHGKTASLAQRKAEIETQEGWEIVPSKLTKSVKLKKPKPPDILLEDEVWSMLVRMGFDQLSKDRLFKIFIDEETNPRQIDVFAMDTETALLFECTTSEERKEKNLNDLIEKILSISVPVFNSINKHYGPDVKLKVRWVIATRNIQWRPVDLTKAAANKIVVLRDEEIDYFKKLTDLLKMAAKYQLLAYVFSEERIHEIDIKVPATKGRMGKQTFYNFLIRPFDLLKIAYISHKKSRTIKDAETYQRMVTPKRLKAIAKYIDSGGQFPTNIVINIKSKQALVFDRKDIIGESSFGVLHLPNRYASAWVIDGQHRLYGYAYSKRMAKHETDKATFPVLAYENLPPMEEAGLFVDINSKQERVKQNLIKEIYADLKWESKDLKERFDALRSRTAIKLNSTVGSPLYERFALASKSKSSTCCLTLSSFADGLKENKFFGEQTTAVFKPGPLYASYEEDLDESLEKAAKVLTHFFELYQKAMPEHWALGDGPGGYLCTNNGIRSLLIVLRAILVHVKDKLKIDLDDLPAESIVGYIDTYVDPLIKFFSVASPDTIKHFRSRQAIKGVNDNAVELMAKIHDQIEGFCPDKLKEYLDTIDVKGTEEAKKLMGEIQITMFRFVTDKLKEQFGDSWWYEGIPEKVRVSCSEMHQKEKGVKKVEQYIHLLDYQTIALTNWPLFEKSFSMAKQGSKEKKVKWIADLNVIRNITHHEEKWPATKEQVAFVKEVHRFVMKSFV